MQARLEGADDHAAATMVAKTDRQCGVFNKVDRVLQEGFAKIAGSFES